MRKNIVKCLGTGLLSLALSTVWLVQPASAQIDDVGAAPVVQDDDDGFDWGLLGLLGLLGLGGLMRRDHHRNDHRVAATTTTNPRT